jgi:hypothetical protein
MIFFNQAGGGGRKGDGDFFNRAGTGGRWGR